MFARRTLRLARLYSTAPAPGGLLPKLRLDLKASMKAKDTNRLNVLRNVLAEITNASKTQTSEAMDDMRILQIITKVRAKSVGAVDECKAAGRADLVAKEEAQIAVLDQLAGEVETVGRGEIEEVVRAVKAELGEKAGLGSVMKETRKRFEGRPVVAAEIAVVVKQTLGV
ncbi:Yqey-like protein-domain-containing protein [Geopyxis carbonaria]|nr:Yqey-like protein-domain-containing protein [Geopyxis carbonaria]